ncbi:hypothetical protein [Pseudomonas fragariae (ex Marin et al. 2024)]|uniref:Nicotinic acid phosphoribosyltransferase n=2 Tax=Pseudomonas fragariae (ex Marin et al. 2024) TaxID=3080056 RepID=A0ABT3LDL4_9PSED|nr:MULTISPECIES: hypothetical protein [unclassified Pseudomonas]MCW6054554.1 hypothetical protein [Pseudomonas fragi]MDV0424620.1 hypothetical protein [Pseudomonas sp. 17]MDX9570379.1 hypothetical protein [Pseudomonas sp. 21(2023)]MDX9584172.1 hypothetical protein [Pseudomonas sp. 19(2023)]MDY6476248.1 hypothetical protein [Pseudomonas sp. 18]
MSARNKPLCITHECRSCGHHHPFAAVMPAGKRAPECPSCHSGEVVELELVHPQWSVVASSKAPDSKEYTVVFRMSPGTSRKAFMKKLTDTFVDHEVEILEIQSGDKLGGSGGQ